VVAASGHDKVQAKLDAAWLQPAAPIRPLTIFVIANTLFIKRASNTFFINRTIMSIYDKLAELNITLPPVAIPAAAYVPFVQSGNLVFLSGHIAKKDGKAWVGQFGKNISTAEGQQAARAIAIDLLGTLHAAVGDLNRVKRIVKLMSLVNSTGDFTEQHLVTNGASELIGQVFGAEKGAHARSAFGVAQIPMGACVEIELIAELA
jgi:enamine deaminase RidA (YjgF/YER057c/UK114 family)